MHRDMPDYGRNHDDAIYYNAAKTLSQGGGYRIDSLPEKPYETKFPPLYPTLLAPIWKLNPAFPENLKLVAVLSWILFAAALALSTVYWRGDSHAWAITLLLGINPYVILWGASVFSELAFLALVLGSFLAARRAGWKWAALAGSIAGTAYLTRTAGMPLLIAFAAAMLPFVAGWMLWSRTHMYPSNAPDLAYYIDYVRYHLLNVTRDDLGVVLWRNIDQLLFDFGSPLLPAVVQIGAVHILTQVIGVAAISGIIRLVKRGVALDYSLFAAFSLAMLAVWHFPPNERFTLPLFPLFIAGLLEEFSSLAQKLRDGFRHRDASQRAAAWILASLATIVVLTGVGLQVYMSFIVLPQQAEVYRSELRHFRAAYDWISQNTPRDAKILSTDDPLLYTYTGHAGNALPYLSRWSYTNDRDAAFRMFADIVPYCRSRGFDYVLWTVDNRVIWVGDETLARIENSVRTNPQLAKVYAAGPVTIFKVTP
jgi:hypothetical protein